MTTKYAIKSFFLLIKPGIVSSNMLTAAAGFFLALDTGAIFEIDKLLLMLISIGFVIAGSCLINNVIDFDIDPLMERTQNRREYFDQFTQMRYLLIAGTVMIAFGFILMSIKVNVLSGVLALLGAFIYIVPYTLWSKRRSVHGTLIGAFSGSIPPFVGYVAQKKGITPDALMIYIALFSWQMAHFYAIGIYRLNDYQNAKISIRPVIKGIKQTQKHIIAYCGFYCLIILSLLIRADLNKVVSAVIMISCLWLLFLSIKSLQKTDHHRRSAYGVFVASIVSISIFSLGVIIDKFATSMIVAVT